MSAFRPRARRAALVVGLAGLALAAVADRVYEPEIESSVRERVRVRMAPYADGLRGAVQRRLGVIVGLRAFADGRASRGQFDAEFPPYAAGAIEGTPGVRALQFIEDGRISMIEPRRGNEAALGMDVANAPFPGTRRDHERSLRAERPMVTGPVRLQEGGIGLVLRQRLTPRAGFPQVAGVVLDAPTLVSEAGLPDPRSGLRLEVRILDDDSWLGGDAAGSAVRPESLVVAVETGRWVLLGAPVEGWDAAMGGWKLTFRATLVGGVLLAVLVAFALLGRQDRLRAEVESSGSALELALRAGRMGAWGYDIHTGAVHVSDIAAALLGVEARYPGDAPRRVASMMPEEDRARVGDAFKALCAGEREGYVEELRLERPDGSTRWVLAVTHLERDESGRPARIAAVVSDVTERHTLEEQVRQARRVESEGILAGGVAHDFNNLLMAITGFAELARARATDVGGPAAEEIVNDVWQVLSSAQRGTSLTSQLLAFSRRTSSAPTRVDVSRAVGELQPILARLLAGRVDVVAALGLGLQAARTEAGQLTQVVMNLLVVARDSMPGGGGVTLRTFHVPAASGRRPLDAPPGEWICVEIASRRRAPGDAPPMRRAERRDSEPSSPESGLSVAVVQGVVATAGGHLSIETAPGKETSFRVYLPLWRDVAEGEPAARVSTGSASAR